MDHHVAAAADGSTTSATVVITDDLAFYRVERSAALAYLSEDFEGEVVGWTTQTNGSASATTWELGTPTVVGPPAANSGTNLYGTDLDAAYEDFTLGEGNKGITLLSPVINLAGNTFVTLEFAYFLDLAADEQGGGRINILDEQGGSFMSIEPLLTDSNIAPEEVVSGEWAKIGPIRLPQNVTDAIKIMIEFEFEFLSAESAEANGGSLHIDDIVVK